MPVNGAYTNWSPNHPGGNPLNYCLTMEARLGTWYNMDCTGTRPYVCEQY